MLATRRPGRRSTSSVTLGIACRSTFAIGFGIMGAWPMARAPWKDPRLEDGMLLAGKIVKPRRPDLPGFPPPKGRGMFPEPPRDPWPWISLALSLVALAVAVLAWWRT